MATQKCPAVPGLPVGMDLLDAICNQRVFIETYGCRYNFGDTAKLAAILRHNGNTLVASENDADIVIVNTCTVVGPTERRMLRRLAQLSGKKLVVTGCMPAVQREAIFAVCNPEIIHPEAIQEKCRHIDSVEPVGGGIVQIARGCPGACTYCITRFARGPLRSFPGEEIGQQVQAAASVGVPEIQLTAQDVSAWGIDTGRTFAGLLADLDGIPGSHMFRVGMMNPATAMRDLDALVRAFGGSHIFRFVHLPVQSGSDRILAEMGRGYTVRGFEEIVSAFRKVYPDITVMTDMIVGFCGETEEDFEESMDLIRRIRPNKVNVTRYSARPFTPLAGRKEFPDSVKKDRSRAMTALAERIYADVNRPLLKAKVPVLVTEQIRPGSVMARTLNYTGVVLNRDLPLGYRGEAVLKKDRKYFFIGELVL